MKAKPKDKSVCPYCNGTGTELIKMGKYTYGRICKREPRFRCGGSLE